VHKKRCAWCCTISSRASKPTSSTPAIVEADVAFADVDPADYDALVITGGRARVSA
jgi:putative intracellular protease/amidase